MANQIRSDGKNPALADAVASLINPKIYQSVLETVRERAESAKKIAADYKEKTNIEAAIFASRPAAGATILKG